MRDSVPSTRYSSVCNVLRQWRIRLISTYTVNRLYDIKHLTHHPLSLTPHPSPLTPHPPSPPLTPHPLTPQLLTTHPLTTSPPTPHSSSPTPHPLTPHLLTPPSPFTPSSLTLSPSHLHFSFPLFHLLWFSGNGPQALHIPQGLWYPWQQLLNSSLVADGKVMCRL